MCQLQGVAAIYFACEGTDFTQRGYILILNKDSKIESNPDARLSSKCDGEDHEDDAKI